MLASNWSCGVPQPSRSLLSTARTLDVRLDMYMSCICLDNMYMCMHVHVHVHVHMHHVAGVPFLNHTVTSRLPLGCHTLTTRYNYTWSHAYHSLTASMFGCALGCSLA